MLDQTPPRSPIEKLLALEMIRVTEAAAIACARYMGRGDRMEADRAATEAMRTAMDELDIAATIVIGEGERDEAPMLYIGEKLGRRKTGDGSNSPEVDIAVDPLEGTNLVATGSADAITVLAATEKGGLLNAPDTYFEKLAVGPVAAGHVDIRLSPTENLNRIAEALGRGVNDITVIILDRPRHADLIAEVRQAGARIKLITDGDVIAAISCAVSGTGVHAVMGIGGAPEGVLAAAARAARSRPGSGSGTSRSASEPRRWATTTSRASTRRRSWPPATTSSSPRRASPTASC